MMSAFTHEVSMRRPVQMAQSAGTRMRTGIFEMLSRREWQVASLAIHPNAEISRQLNMAEGTVRAHMLSISRKTGLETRAAIAVFADRAERGMAYRPPSKAGNN